jgi:hypothetical protein
MAIAAFESIFVAQQLLNSCEQSDKDSPSSFGLHIDQVIYYKEGEMKGKGETHSSHWSFLKNLKIF